MMRNRLDIPRSIQLTGSDFFSLVMERKTPGSGADGNVCRLVLRLDGRADAESLRASIRESGLHEWLSTVRWSRPLPFMTPRWKFGGGGGDIPIEERECPKDFDPSSLMTSDNARVSPFRPPAFAFTLLHHPDNTTTLLFTWHHAITDARGAEMLLGLIGRQGVEMPPIMCDAVPSWQKRMALCLKMPARVYSARKSIHAIVRSTRPPIAGICPAGKEGGGRRRCRLISFDQEQTRLIDENCVVAGANFRNSLFYLAATIRALNTVLRGRSVEPAAWAVPVPQDNRRRGQRGPVISNHHAFLFFRAEKADVATLKSLVESLSRQMKEQVQSGIPESFSAAMELFRGLPVGLFSFLMNRPTSGQVASFFFSYAGEISHDLDRFLNQRVAEVRHMPPVFYPPGLSVSFSRRNGRLQAAFSYLDGCIGDGEMDVFEKALRLELLEVGNG